MDISQLKTLIHVAEVGSLSKAADRLGIAQPALSRQVRLLEKELGTLLFQRDGRGMVLTKDGRYVLKHAGNILAELDAIRAISTVEGERLQGLVMVGATPTVTAIATVPLVERILALHPELSIRLASAFTGHLIDWILRGELDIAVAYNPQPLRSLRVEPVLVEDLVYVQGDGQLNFARPVRFADLADEKLVLPSPRHGLRAIMDECARKAGVKLNATLEADSFQVMIDLVEKRFGGTVLPLASIYHKVVGKMLSVAPIVEPSPTRTLVLVQAADRPATPAVRFVATSFLDIARKLVAEGVWSGRMVDRGKVHP